MSSTTAKNRKKLGGFVGIIFAAKIIWSILCFGAAAIFVVSRWSSIVSFILNR